MLADLYMFRVYIGMLIPDKTKTRVPETWIGYPKPGSGTRNTGRVLETRIRYPKPGRVSETRKRTGTRKRVGYPKTGRVADFGFRVPSSSIKKMHKLQNKYSGKLKNEQIKWIQLLQPR